MSGDPSVIAQQRPAGVPASLLGVRVGEANWLLPLEDAGEIMAVPELTRVPLTKAWYLGLANVRGKLVSVIDLALFSGARGRPLNAEARLVMVADRYRCHCALVVEGLLGLKDTRKMTTAGADDAVAQDEGTVRWRGATYRDDAGALWRELNVSALVADDGFFDAGL